MRLIVHESKREAAHWVRCCWNSVRLLKWFAIAVCLNYFLWQFKILSIYKYTHTHTYTQTSCPTHHLTQINRLTPFLQTGMHTHINTHIQHVNTHKDTTSYIYTLYRPPETCSSNKDSKSTHINTLPQSVRNTEMVSTCHVNLLSSPAAFHMHYTPEHSIYFPLLLNF